jgi:flagellar biosynthetic protein FliP
MRPVPLSIVRELALVALVMLALALTGASHARAESRPAHAAATWNAADEMTRPATHGKTAAPGWARASARDATAQPIRIVLGLTILAIVPALLICTSSFLRIVIVLSMLRHALGMQDTPPNSALIGLALFLTLFTMSPVLQDVDRNAFQPFMQGSLSMEDAYQKGVAPMRGYMIRQTREQDIALMIELSKAPPPASIDEVGNVQLIPAYMLSELRAAFQIGFVIFLPFVLIDLVVACILMALGMMMMPPTTISLPLKILMFVLIDGWSLLLKALVGSFH